MTYQELVNNKWDLMMQQTEITEQDIIEVNNYINQQHEQTLEAMSEQPQDYETGEIFYHIASGFDYDLLTDDEFYNTWCD